MTITEYKTLIETRLDIPDYFLKVVDNKIAPNFTKAQIKLTHTDDLFMFFNKKPCFKSRFKTIVADLTDRKVLTGNYFLIRKEDDL